MAAAATLQVDSPGSPKQRDHNPMSLTFIAPADQCSEAATVMTPPDRSASSVVIDASASASASAAETPSNTPAPSAVTNAPAFDVILASPNHLTSSAVADSPVSAAVAVQSIPPTSPAGLEGDSSSAVAVATPNPSSASAALMSSPTTANNIKSQEADSGEEDLVADDAADHGAPREFECMFDEYSKCKTGQYNLKLSRKVISNHFGRNKGCTRLITGWPLFCRKHYQRATYKPDLWQRRKIDLIARMLDTIEHDFPGTTYEIALKKSEERRLNEFARKLSGGMSVEMATAATQPNTDIKAFQAPIDVLRHLEPYIGPGKSVVVVKECVSLILDMLVNEETKEVPSIEFLPTLPGSKAKAPKVKANTARVSKKGAVKKADRKG
ncbi:hypothetical protein EJ04DRAFT_572825 [Polyplosphaeria fusca]|uniref:Uncharacterized protein n=1 Tax=Polyplosphaeria fusca TaxID=682080 RepID=A0A9P4RAY1_9PLEO|nr:hypothetical protein EJ04DRAFT_572825 [Polyplosphaeria fusca]